MLPKDSAFKKGNQETKTTMSNSSTAAVRGSRAPPGRRFASNSESEQGLVSTAVSSCASSATCCMGDAESGLQQTSDDKYRKRFRQRKQQRLRNGLMALAGSLLLLIFTYVQLSEDDGEQVRLARKGERPKYKGYGGDSQENPHMTRELMKERQRKMHHMHRERGLNDDHNKDDQHGNIDDQSEENKGGWFDRFAGHHGNGEDEESVYQRRLLELEYLSDRMNSNTNTSIRWADMSDVPPLPGRAHDKSRNKLINNRQDPRHNHVAHNKEGKYKTFFKIHRPNAEPMAWEEEYEAITNQDPTARPDYVNYVHHKYNYPEKLMEPPTLGEYPFMRTYKELMDTWPQDNLDNPPDVLQEDLIHFDWNIEADMEAAVKFREAKLPFKVVNVPEVVAATTKWTDEYLINQFDTNAPGEPNGLRADGKCNEGPDNFFAFFNVPLWDVDELGIPPTRDNDWSFARWTKHSHYADRVGLHPHKPHYYWQSGVAREERFQKKSQWSFVSNDLPSFSSTSDNFILFHHEHQKGIQCRFGERGITAANHYDSGRNMIAMIKGAKRYILSPPRACKKLGIVSSKGHASFRHSMLNYGHIALMENSEYSEEMPEEEREWLEMTGTAEAVSTVLKEGEILYVPTGWFHYITSLQKSAQCNVRSGPDMDGDEYWGGGYQITADCFPHE